MHKSLQAGIAIIAAVATFLTGCSVKQETEPGEKGKPVAKKNIVIEYWTTPAYQNVGGKNGFGEWEQAKIAEFQKDNPNVKINFQLIPYDAIEQKVTVAALGNNPPDILLDGLDRRIMKYVQFGKSEEVSDLIKDDLKDYNKNTLDVLTKDGKLYGIPISMNPQHMFINRKIFRDKGLESLIPENRDWTFPQWRDAMKKVSGNGVYGSAIFAGNEQGDELPMLYMFGNGAEQWNNESSEVVLGQYKEAAEVLQMFKDMVKEGSLAPGPASLKSLDVLEMFKQGKLAMIARGEDLYATIENGKKDGSANKDIELYGMKPVHKEGVKPKYSFSVTGYTLFKQDDPDKREMVKKLIKMMTAPENTKLLAQSGGYIPARSSSSYETENKDKSAMMKLIAELPGANIGTRSPYYSDVRAFWFPSFQAALLDNMTPEQAIKDYTDKANKLIKDKSSKK